MTAAMKFVRSWAIELLILPALAALAMSMWNWRVGEIDATAHQLLVNRASSTEAARRVLSARLAAGPIRNHEVSTLLQVLDAMHDDQAWGPDAPSRHVALQLSARYER